MSDLIERAEAAMEGVTPGPWDLRDGFIYPLSIRCGMGGIWKQDAHFIAAARTLVPELVAELKAARASGERHLHEIFHLQDDLKAARAQRDEFHAQLDHESAENEQLRTALGEERLIEWLEDHAKRIAEET